MSQLPHASPDCTATAAAPSHLFSLPTLPTARNPPGLQSVAMRGSHNFGSWAQNLLLMVTCSAFLCWCLRNTLLTAAHIPRDPFIHQQTPGAEQGQEHRNTGTWCLIFRSARYLQTLLQLIGATSPVHLEGQGQRRAAAQHIPGKAFACWNFFHILVWQVTRTECLKPWLWHTSSLAAVWEGPEDLTERLQSKNTFSCFIHSAGTSLKVFIHLFAAVQCRHWFQEHSRCEQGH